jgi:hypothetical protein
MRVNPLAGSLFISDPLQKIPLKTAANPRPAVFFCGEKISEISKFWLQFYLYTCIYIYNVFKDLDSHRI